MKKQLTSTLLTLCMVPSLVPATAFAKDAEETPKCTCEEVCTVEAMNAECPICGAEGALAESYEKCTEAVAESEAPEPEETEPEESKVSEETPEAKAPAAQPEAASAQTDGVAVHSDGIAIDPTNFPDKYFREFVEANYDTDNDGKLSDAEIKAVTSIICRNKKIADLKGIEHFTELTSLNCWGNRLTSLDLSENTTLTYLNCELNPRLTSLDVSGCTSLLRLDCRRSKLTELDASGCTALSELRCTRNRLTSLDVSGCTTLTYLGCSHNRLTELDTSGCTALSELDCANNQLTELDVSGNTALTYLDCDDNAREIVVGNDRTFDLSTLSSSFDADKASDWTGGTTSGDTLTVSDDEGTVAYEYDCGSNYSATFTLNYIRSADYTRVDAVVAKANALDRNLYKDFSGVESAIDAVDRNKSYKEQEAVNEMAETIEDAIAALQYKDADYAAVDAAISEANALDKNKYKDFSGVEAALSAVVRGKNVTEQDEVDAMAKAIKDAIAVLERADTDATPKKEPANAESDDSDTNAEAEASDNTPQTGDSTNLTSQIALLLASAGAAIGAAIAGRRKKHNK